MKTVALYATLLITVVTLTACVQPADINKVSAETYHNAREVYGFKPVCLDGVEYWSYHSNHMMALTVRIDPNTLQPRRCEDPR